jgi:hypothetical protein
VETSASIVNGGVSRDEHGISHSEQARDDALQAELHGTAYDTEKAVRA